MKCDSVSEFSSYPNVQPSFSREMRWCVLLSSRGFEVSEALSSRLAMDSVGHVIVGTAVQEWFLFEI